MLCPNAIVVASVDASEFHGPDASTNKLVEGTKIIRTIGKSRGKVISCAPNDSIEAYDDVVVEVSAANGVAANFILKSLNSFVANLGTMRTDFESEELERIGDEADASFL